MTTASQTTPLSQGPSIHPTAVVHSTAVVHPSCVIGPYCVVESHVILHENVRLKAHVFIGDHTEIGEGCEIHPYAVIGNDPQSVAYRGEPTKTIIGKKTIIREYVTINRGTVSGGGETRVGDGCFIMTSAHIAHDSRVGNYVQFANCATIGGHVEVGDYAILGGLCAVHQFVRIGSYAMIGGMAGVKHDVIPYGLVSADDTKLSGLNLIGLKKRGFATKDIQELRRVYNELFEKNDMPFAERLKRVQEQPVASDAVAFLLQFIQNEGDRTLCFPPLS